MYNCIIKLTDKERGNIMAFMDKMNAFARSVGDKASDTVEITKYKTKISKEKSTIKENYEKIGDYIYKKYRDNEYENEDLKELLEGIDDAKAKICEYEEEIKRVKLED